jgi:hypothetical protein
MVCFQALDQSGILWLEPGKEFRLFLAMMAAIYKNAEELLNIPEDVSRNEDASLCRCGSLFLLLQYLQNRCVFGLKNSNRVHLSHSHKRKQVCLSTTHLLHGKA